MADSENNFWTRLSDGKIFQYGSIKDLGYEDGWIWSNFPTAFPHECESVTISYSSEDPSASCGIKWNASSFGYYPRFKKGNADLHWMAIGY